MEEFKQRLLEAVGNEAVRESLINFTFDYMEAAIAELVEEGKLYVEADPFGEPHLDRFRLTP